MGLVEARWVRAQWRERDPMLSSTIAGEGMLLRDAGLELFGWDLWECLDQHAQVQQLQCVHERTTSEVRCDRWCGGSAT